jgi:osmotically-inducible protein OsmY
MTDPEHAARINAAITQYEKELVAARVNAEFWLAQPDCFVATGLVQRPMNYRERRLMYLQQDIENLADCLDALKGDCDAKRPLQAEDRWRRDRGRRSNLVLDGAAQPSIRLSNFRACHPCIPPHSVIRLVAGRGFSPGCAALAIWVGNAEGGACSLSLDREITMLNESDAALKTAVLAELAWEPSVTAAHIGVTARDGVISLSGHVQRFAEKQAAQSAVLRVKGVKAVAEEIEVKLPFDTVRSDDDIARAAIDRLAWDSTLPKDAVKVTVQDGWVTLTGEVGWHFEHDAAAQNVRRLWGVVGVSNQITLKPRVNTYNLTSDISTALHRSWFAPNDIKVAADGGKVTLTGHVKSWSERELAGSTAWGAPGATDVENYLIID